MCSGELQLTSSHLIAQLIGILLKCWNVCKAWLHKSTSLALVQLKVILRDLREQELGGINGISIQADNGKLSELINYYGSSWHMTYYYGSS